MLLIRQLPTMVRNVAAIASMTLAAALLNACGGDSVQQASRYSIGGTVNGLLGKGLVLQDNGVDNLTVPASGVFTFPTPLSNGSSYAVTVATQPSNPTQECVITAGTGSVSGDNVTNVLVTCATEGFAVGGTVNGLSGSGLVLQDNGGSDLPITSDGAFTFTNTVGSSLTYKVTIKTQPSNPTQTCSVANGSGTIGNSNVLSVAVNCVNQTYFVGGNVSGLAGTGLVLQDNGGDDLAISASGPFTFATAVNNGSAYAVTVKTQPSNLSQTCTVANGSGTINSAAISNVSVTCTTNAYSITATVVDATANPGGAVLQNNGAGNLNVTGTGSFTFAQQVASGQAYKVTVLTQPNLNPAQYCVPLNGTGTVAGSNVTVTVSCSNVGKYLFVANTYDASNGDVSGFTINASTGGLTAATGSPFAADGNPAGVALDPTGQYLYVANLTTADITEFTVGAGAVLTFVANYDTSVFGTTNAKTFSVAVDPLGGFAFAGSGNSLANGVVDAFSVTAGALTEVSPTTSGNNPLALALDPSGKFVFATNKYDNDMRVFSIGNTGALTSVSTQPYATGNNPVGVAVDPAAAYVYVANNGDGTVSAFGYDTGTGALNELTSQGSPYVVGSGATSGPTGATVDPTGRFLYVTNYTDGTVQAFSIASLTGKLTAVGSPVTTGAGPSDVKVDPSGHFAYVANFLSNTLSIYTIDASTGALTAAGSVPAGNASAALAID